MFVTHQPYSNRVDYIRLLRAGCGGARPPASAAARPGYELSRTCRSTPSVPMNSSPHTSM
jgi:hypothetical protein